MTTPTYLHLFSFKSCQSIILYTTLLAVIRELSRFCKMARRSKVVGPR